MAAIPLLASCGDSSGGSPSGPKAEPFYFAVISDTHVLEDEQALQNTIFTLTAEILNAFVPPLDFVVVTGDIVDFLPSDEPDYYNQHDTALHRLAHLASGLRMPLHLVMGNHDYYTGGELFHHVTASKQGREQLYTDLLGMPGPFYAFEDGGAKFYCLNSLQQDPSIAWESNTVGCIGAEQAAWLDRELDDGKPAFIFHHHPLATEATVRAGFSVLRPFEIPRADGHFAKYQGTPYQDYTDPIYEVLGTHQGQIRASFFGHTHLFLKDSYEGASLYMTDSMQFPSHSSYDGQPMRFHIVECQPGGWDFVIANAYMIRYPGESGARVEAVQGFSE